MSVTEKVQRMYQVWIKKTNTSESPFKRRNNLDGVKTAELMLLQDKSGGNLFTGQVTPGIEVA